MVHLPCGVTMFAQPPLLHTSYDIWPLRAILGWAEQCILPATVPKVRQYNNNGTERGSRIGRALVSRVGDCGFKSQLSQTNDL